MLIYRVTNIVDRKVYIGQSTRSIDKRMKEHLTCAKRPITYFHKALHKHGTQTFQVDVIDTADNIVELNAKEEYWIAHYDSINAQKGYNMLPGGLNHTHLKSTKVRISTANKLIVHTKEHNLKVSMARKGYRPTKEALKNQSLAHLGKKPSITTKLKMSLSKQGKLKSEETKLKMRKPRSKEHRKNISLGKMGNTPWNKGKTNVYSVETLANMSTARTEYCARRKNEKVSKIIC